jgi:hypothetical protein
MVQSSSICMAHTDGYDLTFPVVGARILLVVVRGLAMLDSD